MQLTNLTSLSLAGNELTTLPPEIEQLTNLKFLSLADNELTTLPSEIGRLTNLISLDVFNNKLTRLPSEIGNLKNLTSLYLFNNQLTTLPAQIAQLSELTVTVGGNPLRDLPYILSQTDDSKVIIDYAPGTPSKRLNEAKIILVGAAGSGKTSLVKRLIEDTYNPAEAPTEEISIRRWSIDINSERFRLNVWDFGGQEIMYATHQFFLTKRSLYLLVLKADQEDRTREQSLDYWLKMIRNFGQNAAVIVVTNRTDKSRPTLDPRRYQKEYPNIKAFVNTSCKTGQGIGYLNACIQREVCQLEHMGHLLPSRWFAIKSQVEKKKSHYFSYEDYKRLCRAEVVNDQQEQEDLIELLHDLGLVSLPSQFGVESSHIVNPKWLINGVYKILNHDITYKRKGILALDELHTILDKQRYPRQLHFFITDMMAKFELSFEFKRPDNLFLIPDLLSTQKPNLIWDEATCLGFQYHYDVLPSSIISRFIVRMHGHVQPNQVWRSGVILSNDETHNEALVYADYDQKKILVWVKGAEATRETFLKTIISHFDHINSTIPEIKSRQFLVWPGSPAQPIRYDKLLERYKGGQLPYYEPDVGGEIDPRSLINQIELNRKPTITVKKQDFIELKTLKEVLDQSAWQYVERIRVWFRLGGVVLVIGVFGVLLQIVGWNNLNPWVWLLFDQSLIFKLMGLVGSLISLYFIKNKISLKPLDEKVFEWQRKKEYDKFREFGVELADDQEL